MPLAFRPERITPRARDPDFRDRDELAVGPNLFGCDSRHALSDQRGNHTGLGPWALSHACATPSRPTVASMTRALRCSALRGIIGSRMRLRMDGAGGFLRRFCIRANGRQRRRFPPQKRPSIATAFKL